MNGDLNGVWAGTTALLWQQKWRDRLSVWFDKLPQTIRPSEATSDHLSINKVDSLGSNPKYQVK